MPTPMPRLPKALFALPLITAIAGSIDPVVNVKAAHAQSESLNTALLSKAVEQLQGSSGAVVVLQVQSEEILAAHSMRLAGLKRAYPGSTLKPFTLLALLESGNVNEREPVFCRRELRIGRRNLDCTHNSMVGPLMAADALAHSCNAYFAAMVGAISDMQLTKAFQRFGLDSHTRLTDRESAGVIRPARSDEQKKLKGVGADGIEVTPLGLAVAYRKLAMQRTREVAPELNVVFQGLEQSVEYGRGAPAQGKTMRVAGKTGTAVAKGKQRTHGWFAGYAPADSPQIIVVVFLENGNGAQAAEVAGVIFRAYELSAR